MKIRTDYTCPLEIVHDVTKGKWKTIILWSMRKGGCSLSEMEKGIEGISQKMLLEQLKELQDFGMVGKTSFEGYPLRVEYFLLDRGKKMVDAIGIMQQIGIEYMLEIGQVEILKEKELI